MDLNQSATTLEMLSMDGAKDGLSESVDTTLEKARRGIDAFQRRYPHLAKAV